MNIGEIDELRNDSLSRAHSAGAILEAVIDKILADPKAGAEELLPLIEGAQTVVESLEVMLEEVERCILEAAKRERRQPKPPSESQTIN